MRPALNTRNAFESIAISRRLRGQSSAFAKPEGPYGRKHRRPGTPPRDCRQSRWHGWSRV